MFEFSSYVGIHQAAKRLKVHEESLRRIIRIGTLKAEKIGGQWYINKDELEIFVATYDPKTGKRKYMI